MSRRRRRAWLAAALFVVACAALSPWAVRAWWAQRSANPVRRGIALADRLGCFQCHGPLGHGGLPDPGPGPDVPGWSGGVWMMYVAASDDIREFILDGVSHAREGSPAAIAERASMAIRMPAYRDRVDEGEVDDLVAAFQVLSGRARPSPGTIDRRGADLVVEHRCDACHGPAGSGGLPNPGSFAGFIPGWYGPDFDDLVRGRDEFDEWIRTGTSERLRGSRVAAWFLDRQKLAMPAYAGMPDADLDALWAYVAWLRTTDGGHAGVEPSPW